MFNFFKKDISQIDELKYQMLATLITSGSMASTMLVMASASKDSPNILKLVFNETLVFSTCLVQMRAQGKFKFAADGSHILEMVQALQGQFAKLAEMGEIKTPDVITITPEMLCNATTEEFLERTLNYAARNYQYFGITEEFFDQFCKRTGMSAALLKGAGINLATVIFQMVILSVLDSDGDASSEQRNLILKNTREFKSFLVEKIDRLLVQGN